MIFNIIILFCLIFGILFILWGLKNSILEKNEQSANFVYKAEKSFFDIFNNFLQTGRDYNKSNQYTRKSGMKDIITGAVWESACKHAQKLDPEKRFSKKVKELIAETIIVLDEARENAKRLCSQDALDYVEDCLNELSEISLQAHEQVSYSEVIKKIEQIKNDAKEIARSEFFSDVSSQEIDGKKDTSQNYYQILELSSDANLEDIKKAYRRLVNLYHPDKYEHLADDLRTQAIERFKLINEAYKNLSEKHKN